jgi:hypothetical protein
MGRLYPVDPANGNGTFVNTMYIGDYIGITHRKV